eukprot:c17874_g1_i1 orf=402-857(+)
MTGSLMTGDKLRHCREISDLCPWCKAARETRLHLFWSCPATKGFWGVFGKKPKRIFGVGRLTMHMVLLGLVRDQSAEFSFIWQLCRAIATACLWKERNNYKFQGAAHNLSGQQVVLCLFRTTSLLKAWNGKGKEEDRKILGRLYVELLDEG